MYDYYLGGKDNYAADREAAEKALTVVPHGRRIARANRAFLAHAVERMARSGICQFIDLGTGIPTSPSVHEVARAIEPRARVLYVDNDPTVTVHNRALIAKSAGIAAIDGDIRQPSRVFASKELQELIDFSEPVGMLFVAVLHFIPDVDGLEGIVRSFTKYLAPGSWIAISHITSEGTDPAVMATIEEAYAKASAPAVFRTKAEIRTFVADFDLIPPGLADLSQWFPYPVFTIGPPALGFLAAAGSMRTSETGEAR